MSPIDFVGLARLAQSLPTAANLLAQAKRAKAGDLEALAYLTGPGKFEALDLLKPGAGQMAAAVLEGAKSAYDTFTNGDTVEGEFREVATGARPMPPWVRLGAAGFISKLTTGTVTLLGPTGSAKTTKAVRLAENWRNRLGYDIRGVGLYMEELEAELPSEVYDLIQPVSMADFMDWTQDIEEAVMGVPRKLSAREKAAEKEYLKEYGELPPPKPMLTTDQAKSKLGHRIVLLDEASITMPTQGALSPKHAAMVALTQSRHIGWLVLFIAQYAAGQVSNTLLNGKMTILSRPLGDEAEFDREGRVSRNWQRCIDAFEALRTGQPALYVHGPQTSGYIISDWLDVFPDLRSWAYVIIPDTGNGMRFEGLLPFEFPGTVH